MDEELVERVARVIWESRYSGDDSMHVARVVLAELAGELRDEDNVATHRHFKGGYYRVLTHGKLERDLSEVVIYKAMSDGTVWVRPAFDFYDGRFTLLPKAIDEARHG